VCWNIEGLQSRLAEPGFIDYISRFDVCCFVETFTSENFDTAAYFNEYHVFHSPAVKLSHHGRRSGGVLALVKNTVTENVIEVTCEHDNMLILRFPTLRCNELIVICLYIPPAESPYYRGKDVQCNIELLEDELLELQETYPNASIMICGDLNARTGRWNIHDDADEDEDEIGSLCNMENYVCPNFLTLRNSQDTLTNRFGKILCSMCSVYHLCILNGSTNSDREGKFTYLSQHGASVVDYCLLGIDSFHYNVNFRVGEAIFSSHMPLEMCIDSGQKYSENKPVCRKTIRKFIWDDDKSQDVKIRLQTPEFSTAIQQARELIGTDVDSALQMFVETLHFHAECMQREIRVGACKKRTRAKWYDSECHLAKRNAKKALSLFRKTGTVDAKDQYVRLRNIYKGFIREKKNDYHKTSCRALIDSIKNPRAFWSQIKHASHTHVQLPAIDIEIWKSYFKDLYNQNRCPENNLTLTDTVTNVVFDEELDAPIREEEVRTSIKKLKTGKAPGLDEIPGDYLKIADTYITPFLTELFNVLYEKQYFPETWNQSAIIPLHKSGDKLNPSNYRGISLLSIVSKLFTAILTSRLRKWAEENKKFCVEQAGFRSDHSTIDHVFTLYSIAVKNVYAGGRGKLYVAFVDYKKAFDSVDRSCLWQILEKLGLSTKFISMLKAIYSHVQACVRWDNTVSDLFECPLGVKQGAVESPIIFSLYISYVADFVREHGRHGVQLLPGMMEIFSLLFADDVVLLSTTPVGLQCQINNLCTMSKRLGLSINTQKTKAMVFRRGGFLGQREKWFLNDKGLEVVNRFKYLGFIFTTKLSISAALEGQIVKAKQKTVQLFKAMWNLRTINTNVFVRLFDAQVQPALLYAAELWGLNTKVDVERAHLFACKRFLNIPCRSPNCMVYGEMGRYPLAVNSTVRTIRYWLRLCKMPVDRLPKQVYLMLCSSHISGKWNWAKSVEEFLSKLGFAYVWKNGAVVNERAFLKSLKQRWCDCYCQEWGVKIGRSDRYLLYRSFKNAIKSENYLNNIDVKKFRDVFVRFRLGMNDLGVNRRYDGELESDAHCPFCTNVKEDESHFIFHCDRYADIRSKYISRYICEIREPTLPCLLNGEGMHKTRNVAMYIYYSMKLRGELRDELAAEEEKS